MNKELKLFHHKFQLYALLLGAFLALPFSVLAADDDTPFFAGRTGSPNVMILFDNSNSMQDSPYFKDDGNNLKPSTRWRRGVKINNHCDADTSNDNPADGNIVNGCIADSTPGVPGGSTSYDDSKWISTDTELTLPGQVPPNLPGLTANGSSITSFQSGSACPTPNAGLTCSIRIYDSNVDWNAISAWNNFVPYRYWKIRVTDTTLNTVQYRSISGRNSSSGYWKVLGQPLEYDTTHGYDYKLVGSSPGEVTAEDTYLNRVYDRNFDWSTISSWSTFSSTYRYKILEVYAGTNAGEQRTINSRDSSYGYWKLTSDFPVPCDFTTRYKILGTPDDNKYATGGNHPDSKMYQAKLALKKFLTSGAIKTTDTDPVTGISSERYLMNIGFATFLQARLPKTRAKYYYKVAAVAGVPGVPAHDVHHPATYEYVYKEKQNHATNGYLPNGCVGGTPPTSATFTPWWGITYTKGDGDSVDRTWHAGGFACSSQTITYKVSLQCRPTDSLPGRVLWELESYQSFAPNPSYAGTDPDGNDQWGYTNYTTIRRTGTCAVEGTPPTNYGGWQPITTGHCAAACVDHAAYDTHVAAVDPIPAKEAYYKTYWKDTWGNLKYTSPATPGYINKTPAPADTYIVTPYKGYCGGSWNCVAPDAESGDYTLVTDSNPQINVCLHINNTTGVCDQTGDITKEIFDYSVYRYPGKINDNDHPNGWSYKKTARDPAWLTNWRYRKDDGTYLSDDHFMYTYAHNYPSIWPDTNQPDPYFPAITGDDFSNYDGDDQVVFVNLPEFNNADANKGDDFSGTNISKVLNYINLARVEYPKDTRYVHTMAPISKGSLTVNTESAQTGVGTPLAATLADARKYFESYIAQDNFSQGGCRKNYIILLTDGTETAGGDPVAEAAALQQIRDINNELRPVKVYVVGFGLDQASQTTLNNIAVAGGSGQAYFANNVDELVTILAHDITSDILGGSYGLGKVALTRGGLDTSNGLTLYSAYFDYPIWRGHLDAWSLYPDDVYDVNGHRIHKAGEIQVDSNGDWIGEPHWGDGCSGAYAPSALNDPDAGCIMAEDNAVPGIPPDGPALRRTLYSTKADGTRVLFSPTNAGDLLPLFNITGVDINGDMTTGDLLDAKTIVNNIHHPGFDSGQYVATRDANWPLADIYHSGPVVVTSTITGDCLDTDNDGVLDSGSWPGMDGYCDFAELNKSRDSMLYFGTNGGMIQAITTGKPGIANSGGREAWGYLPQFILPKLQEIKEGHRFTMDLTTLVSEVDTSNGLAGTGWKTMLIAGQRKGGDGYIALDVTDPYNPIPMWEFTDPNLGQTWSRPSVARILINGTKTSVIIFGGGYSLNANIGNRLFIVKASDGTILKEIVVGSNNNNVPSRIALTSYSTNNVGTIVDYRTNLAKLPDGTVVNYSGRLNLTEVAYFGDTSGDAWRLEGLNTEVAGWNPTLVKLYHPNATHERPIYYPPVVSDIKNGSINNGAVTGCVKRYLLLGTGDEHDPTGTVKSDLSPMIDYFFEIEDEGNPGVVNESNLNWRFSLGLQIPSDNGFLLLPDGSRATKGGLDILSKYIFLIDSAKIAPLGAIPGQDQWSVDTATGNLLTPGPNSELAALTGEFLINNAGTLYSDVAMTNLVANAGTYTQVDFGLWLTNEFGWFYDSEDDTPILDASLYLYDNDGYWIDAGGNRKTVNGNEVRLVADAGEKILAAPVGFGGYSFFTSYTPEGGCSTGRSFFYGLKTSTCGLNGGTGVLNYNKVGNMFYSAPRRRIGLGTGITAGVTLGGGMAYIPLSSPGEDKPDLITTPVPVGQTKLKYWKQN